MKYAFQFLYTMILLCIDVMETSKSNAESRFLLDTVNKKIITLPIEIMNGKLYIDLSMGSPEKNFSMMLDTGSKHSWIIKSKLENTTNTTLNYGFDGNASTTYKSMSEEEEIEKIYIEANSQYSLEGNASTDVITLYNKEDSIIINNFDFLLIDNYTNPRISVKFGEFPSKYAGVLSLAREDDKNEDGKFSFLKKLMINGYIDDPSFTIVTGNKEEWKNILNTEENKDDQSAIKSFIIFGKGNTGPNSEEKVPKCNLFKHDPLHSLSWTCNISHIFVSNSDDNEEDFIKNNYFTNSYVLFDIGVESIIIPKSAKMVKMGDSESQNTITVKNKTKVDTAENLISSEGFFTNLLSVLQKCTLISIDPTNYPEIYSMNYLSNIEAFICTSDKTTKDAFLKPLDDKSIKSLNFVFNGYAYKIEIEALFTQVNIENSSTPLYTYYFNIMFYSPRDDLAFPWIFGNLFTKQFDAITFSQSYKEIRFYGGSPKNLTMYTSDIPEIEPIISFFIISVICVILLIIIVLLVPYLLYRKRKRALMEKLQYEVIYKKMDEITREISR